MIPGVLAAAVIDAARDIAADRGHVLPPLSTVSSRAAVLQRCRDARRGDFASPIALRLARSLGIAPQDFAVAMSTRLSRVAGIASVEVVGPGFLNIRLDPAALGELAGVVVAAGEHYGLGGAGSLGDAGGRRGVEGACGLGGAAPRGDTDTDAGADTGTGRLVRAFAAGQRVLDPEMVIRNSPSNPVFAILYAAAETAAVSRRASAVGLDLQPGYDAWRLNDERELELLKVLGEFPCVAALAVELRESYRVAGYLEILAMAWWDFVVICPILPKGDEPVTELMRSRLWLAAATRVVFVNALGLLGVDAPERI